jgi:pyruvate/2-oxoglutarate/acetoin dehydrogenase E1 component
LTVLWITSGIILCINHNPEATGLRPTGCFIVNTHQTLEAAAEKLEVQGINVEVVNPRALVPFDREAILKSVAKTGRLVIVDEEPKMGSTTCSTAAMVAEEGFDCLKKPVKFVCSSDTPIHFSPPLEKFWIPICGMPKREFAGGDDIYV